MPGNYARWVRVWSTMPRRCWRWRSRCAVRRGGSPPTSALRGAAARRLLARPLRRREPRLPVGADDRKSPTPAGIAGGLQAGYNGRSARSCSAPKPIFSSPDADDRFAAWKFSNPWFGTLRARAGYARATVLRHGGSRLRSLDGQEPRTGVSESRTSVGWAVGAGVEVALTTNWSARAEYLYVDLNDRSFVLSGTNNGIELSLLRFGINYRFERLRYSVQSPFRGLCFCGTQNHTLTIAS